MTDTIIVKLQYPVKILGLNLSFKRKVGFTFTNLYKFLFAQDKGLKDSKDFEQWQQTNGNNILISETLYFAAIAYCQLNLKKQNFTKSNLIKSFALTDSETIERILNIWKLSENFGATVKKKVIRKAK